jgi:hypothetical protein
MGNLHKKVTAASLKKLSKNQFKVHRVQVRTVFREAKEKGSMKIQFQALSTKEFQQEINRPNHKPNNKFSKQAILKFW